jgi:aspartate racemase
VSAPAARPVGILGGMGPAAGADFLRLFLEACGATLQALDRPLNDQAYPEHWLAQLPVPDRTEALVHGGASPLPGMARALHGLAERGAVAAAIACNTAHAWHAQLQAACPGIELLHIARETARDLRAWGIGSVALLATPGTCRTGLYQDALQPAGIRCLAPAAEGLALLARGIADVKAGRVAQARGRFESVAHALVEAHRPDAVLLACTEIPLALQVLPAEPGMPLVNPAALAARALAARAYGFEDSSAEARPPA